MKPWEQLEQAPVPGGSATAYLWRRDDEYSIRFDREEVMNSRMHGSEEALAEIACRRIADRPEARVLIGGLGLGFTLAAALRELGPTSEVVVAELVPAVITWNRGVLGHLAGQPLADERASAREGNVGRLIREAAGDYDAILLDVDNGPEALLREGNRSLYDAAGLAAVVKALRPGGIFGIWSVEACPPFSQRLTRAGFRVEEIWERMRKGRGGRRYLITIATRAG